MDKTILFVDDEEGISEIYVDLLKVKGYKVIFLKDPKKAFNQYKLIQPDLVLLDVQMPEMSGIDVAKKIREKDQNTPILFLSGTEGYVNVVKGIEIGANDYIRKDVHLEELYARIKKEIDRNLTKSSDIIYLTQNTYVDRFSNSIVSCGTTHGFSEPEFCVVVLLADKVNLLVPITQVHETALKNRLRINNYTYKTFTKIRSAIQNDKSLELVRIRGFISLRIINKL